MKRANVFDGKTGAYLKQVDVDCIDIVQELLAGNAIELFNCETNEPVANYEDSNIKTDSDGFASLIKKEAYYLIEASETVRYRFYVKTDTEDEDGAKSIVYDYDEIADFVEDSEGFQIDKITNLGSDKHIPKWRKILEKRKDK